MDSTLLSVGLLVTTIGTILSLYLAIKKAPFDVRKLMLENRQKEVELSDKYEAQLNKMSEYNLNLRNEIQEVRTRMDDTSARHATELADLKCRYEKEMEEIRASLLRTEKRAQQVEEWAQRLCAQIVSLGETPVPFEPKSRATRAK